MNILIIQLRRIGDVVVTTPVIDALRQACPGARISFLVEKAAAPVLAHYEGLDEVLVFDKKDFWKWVKEIRSRQFDWVLDFMNNPRTAQLTLLSGAKVRAGFDVPLWGLVYGTRIARASVPKYAVQSKFDLLRALGLSLPNQGVLPKIKLTEADCAPVKDWWDLRGLYQFSEVIGVAPAHRRPIRRWPSAKFLELMNVLWEKQDRAFVLFGGPEEEDYLYDIAKNFVSRVFVIPSGSLRQAAAFLSLCDVVATNDSGLMHLSVSVGTTTVTIYGPTWPECWNPQVLPHRWVQAEGLTCVGCNLDECPYQHECMDWVSVSRVAEEVEKVVHGRD